MRTTLVIPDAVYRKLKRRAAETGKTISGLATEILRRGLSVETEPVELPPLPTADLGPPLVNVADRDALHRVLDAERDRRLHGFGEAGVDDRSETGERPTRGDRPPDSEREH